MTTPMLPDGPLPRHVTLDLKHEPMPWTGWLGAVAPLCTIALLYMLASHWADLVPHDEGVAGMPAWRDAQYRNIAEFLVIGLGWSAFGAILGPAIWHGTSRRHAFRRAQLHFGVAFAWCVALLVPAIVLPVWFRLSWLASFACAVAGLAGVSLLIAFGLPARRQVLSADLPPSTYQMYFDWNDPAAFGDRGTNLGSPWNMALFAVPWFAFLIIPLLLGLL